MLVTLRSSCFKSTRHTLARHIRSRGIRAMTTAAPAEEVAVVGGGIAGLTCASLLAKGGYSVTLLDMGKSHPGGRTTTRRTAHMDLVFDHGAQFFRCQSAEFQAVVEEWQAAGVVATWDGRIGLYSARTGSFTPKEQLVKQQQEQEQPGPDGQRESGFFSALAPGPLYVGAPTMDAVCRHLAQQGGIAHVRPDVRVQRACLDGYGKWLLEGTIRQPVGAHNRQELQQQQPLQTPWNLGVFDALVIADKMVGCKPAPGYVEVTGSSAATNMLSDLEQVGSTPQVALMMAYTADEAPRLPFDAACVSGSEAIHWLANNTSKPGRQRPDGMQCWVAISTPAYSEQQCPRNPDGSLNPQTPEMLIKVAGDMFEQLQAALQPLTGQLLPRPTFMQAQRWGAAYPAQPLGTPCLRADQAKLAACGDFCTGAGVENAVLSAKAAAQAVQQMLRAQEG